jgi:hypothetical protein
VVGGVLLEGLAGGEGAEELGASNPATYLPSEWHSHRFAPFEEWGMDPPEADMASSRNAGNIAAHGYGWSAALKYLASRHGNEVIRRAFENIRSGDNWIHAISSAVNDTSNTWFTGFLISYTMGEVYAFKPQDRIDTIGTNRLYLTATNTTKTFTVPMRNLSGRLYGVNVSTAAQNPITIRPEHRVGFRLDGPLGSRLTILSQSATQPIRIDSIVHWDDGASRFLTDSALPVLGQPQGYYFALVANDKSSPRHAAAEQFTLTMALLEDQTVAIASFSFPGLPILDGLYPPITTTGGTAIIPASSGISINNLLPSLPTTLMYGTCWDDPNVEHEVSLPVEFPEPMRQIPERGETWSVSEVEGYEIQLIERHGDSDMRVVQSIPSATPTFKFKPHVYQGAVEWHLVIKFRVTITPTTGTPSTTDYAIPLVIFMGTAM